MSYGRFRDFLVLLPPERLTGMDAETAWFESATMIPLGAHPTSPVRRFTQTSSCPDLLIAA